MSAEQSGSGLVVGGTRTLAGAVALAALLVGCSASETSSPEPTPSHTGSSARVVPAPESDWPTYHHDNARTGVGPGSYGAGKLSVEWTSPVDGAVYGQPLIIGNLVYSNNQSDTPAIPDALLAMGNGILPSGAVKADIERNRVWDHDRTGCGLVPYPEADANDVPPPAERSPEAAPPTLAETLLSRRRRRK